jgi:putative CocE/NonD family hydrolase
VRLYLQQSGHWLDFEEWPPKSAERRIYLPALNQAPAGGGPDEITYDPADPTPSVGGPLLFGKAKQRDNRAVEARPDVLVYTGEPLTADLDVVGEPTVTVWVRTDRANADVFVRLCDVDPHGVSRNVTEGIVRLGERADGPISPALFPTAYRFRRGHRIRVQVAGGAFPRFSRNHGTGEPVAGAVATQRCRLEVFHDEEHPSYLTLPILAE